jgi:hypothetical protein
MSGPEYAELVAEGERPGARPDWERYSEDTDGYWYVPYCDPSQFENFWDWFDELVDMWFDRGPLFVYPNDTPPVPPLPPEFLLEVATDVLVLPEPVFGRNPMDAENGGTLVNLETWLWVESDVARSGSLTVTAGSGPHAQSVSIEIAMSDVKFSAASAGSVTCTDGGIPWTQGAQSDCFLQFGRRSSGETVTAAATWTGSWSHNGVPQGELEPVPVQWQTDVVVMEAQAVVTRVR